MPTVSVVSGGSRGLGLAIVERLLERGDAVGTFSRGGSAGLEALVARHPGRLLDLRCDAADPDALRRFVGEVATRFGRIDHCIANAAIARDGVLALASDRDVADLLAVNLGGVIVFVREVVRQMLVVPPTHGSITLVSSVVAGRGATGLSTYAATKAGLEGFARSLARELGSRHIRVNVVAPGFLDTELSATLPEADRARIVRRTPLGRLGTPADVVGAIDFLASGRASFVNAQVLAVDGGSFP